MAQDGKGEQLRLGRSQRHLGEVRIICSFMGYVSVSPCSSPPSLLVLSFASRCCNSKFT